MLEDVLEGVFAREEVVDHLAQLVVPEQLDEVQVGDIVQGGLAAEVALHVGARQAIYVHVLPGADQKQQLLPEVADFFGE